MKGFALLLLALAALAGCTTIYERGQKLCVIGSNVHKLHLHSAGGTTVDIEDLDNATIHKAMGATLSGALLSGGTAVATSGLLPKGLK